MSRHAWPYTKAMLAARRTRLLKAWYNRVFTSDRIMTGVFLIFFFTMVYLYVWELH